MLALFFLIWIIFNGRVTAEILLFGCLLSALLFLFIWRILGWDPRHELGLYRNLPVFLAYLCCLVAEIFKSAFAVSCLALSPRRHPDPVLVEFDSGLFDNIQNVLLANAITLTPGTITVVQTNGHFLVHCLRPEYGEGLEKSRFVRILSRIKW